MTTLYILAGLLSYLTTGALFALAMTRLNWFGCAIYKECTDREDAVQDAKVARTMTAVLWPICLTMFLVATVVGGFFSRVFDFVNFIIDTYGPMDESSEDRG